MWPGVTKTELLITGMRNNWCREAVAAALERVDGVKGVHVNLFRALATIIHAPPCTATDLVSAVVRAGFGAALSSDRAARDEMGGPGIAETTRETEE